MREMTRFARLNLIGAALLLLPILGATEIRAQNPCEEQARMDLYTNYYNKKKAGDVNSQKEAYDLAKQFVTKYESCTDKYSEAAKKFIKAYEEALEDYEFSSAVYQKQQFVEAFPIGRRILTRKPNDLATLTELGYAAYRVHLSNNTSFDKEAVAYVANAIQQIEGGKTLDTWSLFTTKEATLSNLYYIAGELHYTQKNYTAALPFLVKAATFEGPMKKVPQTYAKLASVYEFTQYDPMSAAVQKMPAPTTTGPDDAKTKALDELRRVVDNIVDAYARAINLAGDDPKLAKDKENWLLQIKDFYKFRHQDKEDGLPEFIANVTKSPLPPPYEVKP
jgi:hypothetical protein